MMLIHAPYDESSPRAEESLLAVLAGAARRKSDGALAVWAAVGALSAVVIGVALPGWWTLLLLAIGASAFGGWGIVDRELADLSSAESADRRLPAAPATPSTRVRSLRIVRAAIGFIGFVAGAAAVLLLLAMALGTWIS